jgi:hypothetical protein
LPKSEPPRFFLLFLVGVLVFGLALVPLLLLQPNLQADHSPFRRPIMSAIYSIVCIAGIVAVFYPGKCRIMFQKPNVSPDSILRSASSVQVSGHHPDCEKFSGNRITIGSSVFCAACSGLLLGAIASMMVIVLFSLGLFDLGTRNLWILISGEILMLVGLTQIKLRGYIKMAMNSLFVVSSAIILVSADLVAQSLPVDAYVLGLILVMLWFRISLSEWNNKRICLACERCI